MERKEFLKGVSLAGAASLLPLGRLFAGGGNDENKPTSCTLIPSETAGPFPLDLTANTYYFRNDVREDRIGAPLTVRLKIIGSSNCEPMNNLRVNIWHCDKDGIYSGYDTPQNAGGSVSTKWLRGYQMTDANGEVEFSTIFPGWYAGRICHIHFQVYVSTSYAAVSQLTFDIAQKNAVYATFPSLYTKGDDPMTIAQDNVFSDGVTYQLATLTGDATSGYEAYLEVTVQGTGNSGGTGIGHIEKENAKQFSLGQNFPNPHNGATTIPFTLVNASTVKFEIYDLMGRRVQELNQGKLGAGDYSVKIDLSDMGLSQGNYVYQIQVENNDGIFRQCKMMTATR
jgi:protocatechuate 3,4-dioxygenase beta subunit